MAKDLSHVRQYFIELILWWEGCINCKTLEQQFSITRQQANTDLKTYTSHYPNNTTKISGTYYSADTFIAYYITPNINIYLHWFATKDITTHSSFADNVSCLVLPPRKVSHNIIRVLISAIRHKQRIEVDYVSLANPENDGRIFHPHTFVNTGSRWHIRGYCEKSQNFRDLVLSRFRGEAELIDASTIDPQQDLAWHTQVNLILQPDPRLSPAKQAVLANDYQMEGGQLVMSTRAALAQYLLHELQVNTKMLDGTPEVQQLVLVNRDDIKPWLF
ncbi:helix-turn-helix transcriptional regulator [Shewanella psychromarinicola]|uniref:WYL domain-containing protein n=1 Tax=Shewanella psychromarinicola TaxID=2487742 RepID=A0A3N4ED51_9GAMM|nr:WYL domain-containing protein [Shewanella psychromarinicola]AZG36910.1 WYL domain-containing protein [Shewanella psychromarinicola]MCL1082519.1 WYL domain-containing protein [Shewanella psychromarinicola]RPA34766.1 WYL domain-containing protein [Shewanella psychromarinicola]